MRKLTLFTLGCFLSGACFAATTINSSGRPAALLLSALEGAGAVADCGAGTCGTAIDNLQCLMHGNATGVRSYECALLAPDQTGAMVSLNINHRAARKLYAAIVRAGVEGDCGAGTCGVEAKHIQCLMHGNSTGHHTYECSITSQ